MQTFPFLFAQAHGPLCALLVYGPLVWPPLLPVSVALKNKPPIMSSSNIQTIDLPMDCTAWRF